MFRSYVFWLTCGIMAGVFAGTSWAAAHGLDAGHVNAALLILILPALIGARLLFVTLHWDSYRRDLSRILRRSEGGAALYGGLGAALLISVPLLALFQLPFAAFWDAATVTMLTGMCFTKVGCLVNGCCSGRPTRIRIPLQLIEMVLAAVLLGIVVVLPPLFPGAVALIAAAGYGIARYLLEPLRVRVDRIGSLSINRTLSVVLSGLSLMILLKVFLEK